MDRLTSGKPFFFRSAGLGAALVLLGCGGIAVDLEEDQSVIVVTGATPPDASPADAGTCEPGVRGCPTIEPPCVEFTKCSAPFCLVGEWRCDDTALKVCNSDQTGFDTSQVCESEALCEAALSGTHMPACH